MPLQSYRHKRISIGGSVAVAMYGLIHATTALALPAEFQSVDGLVLGTQWQLQSTLFTLGEHRLAQRLHADSHGGSLAAAHTAADIEYQPHAAEVLADTAAEHGLFQISARPAANLALALHAGKIDFDPVDANSQSGAPIKLAQVDVIGISANWFIEGLQLSLQTSQLDTRVGSGNAGAGRADTRLTSLTGDFVFSDNQWQYGPIARLSYASGKILLKDPTEASAKLNSLRYQAGFHLARTMLERDHSGGQLYLQTLWTREFKDRLADSLAARDRYAYQISVGTLWWTRPGLSGRVEYRQFESVGDSDLSAIHGELTWHF